MSKTNTVTVGDLLQNTKRRDDTEVHYWIVTRVEKNKKLPDVRYPVRIGSTNRADNRKWGWAWCELSSLSGQDKKVIYWDPNHTDQGWRLTTTDSYAWTRDAELYTPAEIIAMEEQRADRIKKHKLFTEIAKYCADTLMELLLQDPEDTKYFYPWDLCERIISSQEFSEKFPGIGNKTKVSRYWMEYNTNFYENEKPGRVKYEYLDHNDDDAIYIRLFGKEKEWGFQLYWPTK